MANAFCRKSLTVGIAPGPGKQPDGARGKDTHRRSETEPSVARRRQKAVLSSSQQEPPMGFGITRKSTSAPAKNQRLRAKSPVTPPSMCRSSCVEGRTTETTIWQSSHGASVRFGLVETMRSPTPRRGRRVTVAIRRPYPSSPPHLDRRVRDLVPVHGSRPAAEVACDLGAGVKAGHPDPRARRDADRGPTARTRARPERRARR